MKDFSDFSVIGSKKLIAQGKSRIGLFPFSLLVFDMDQYLKIKS